jgi:FAD/FMN-containing dehydrogenase
MPEWTNWSGSIRFSPQRIETPESEDELAHLVREAASQGRHVRVVGAGHSSSPLVETPELLISMEKLTGLISHDNAASEAVLWAGTRIEDAGKALLDLGLALHNTGDIDQQFIGGSVGTGTHGTGRALQNLSSMLIGGRLITGTGAITEFSIERDPELVCAARVALGTLGIFTHMRLKLLPAFKLHRQEWCTHVDKCLAHLDELIESNRNFDFYWYPRSDRAKLRTLNLPGGDHTIPYAELVLDETDWSAMALPKKRVLKFDEMEYALPAEAGPTCFQEIRKRVKAKHRKEVAWRTLYRTVAADDAYLSPAHGRDTVTISLHHNAGLPYEAYFNDIEPIFRDHGGRPHWGKKHNLTAEDLRPLYPKWDEFMGCREKFDPNGTFLNPYLRKLLLDKSVL